MSEKNQDDVLELDGFVEVDGNQEMSVVLAVSSPTKIDENLELIKTDIVSKVMDAIATLEGDDTTKAKKVRAYARSLVSDLNKKRISVQKEVLKPVDAINAKIKEIEAVVNEAIKPLDEAIAKKEADQLAQRIKEIEAVKAERFAKESTEARAFLTSIAWFDDKTWLNSSTSLAKIRREADAKTDDVLASLSALDIIGKDDPTSAAVTLKYQETGNLAQCLAYRRQLEEAQRMQKERMEAEEAEREAREERTAIQEVEAEADIKLGNVPPPKFMREEVAEEDELFTLTIKCKKSFLPTLGDFMRTNGCLFRLEQKGV